MSKIAQAKMEEQALEVAGFVLDHIEAEVRKDNPNLDKIKILSNVYSTLKPYF